MFRGILLALCFVVAACGHAPRERAAPPPRLPDARARQPRTPPPPEWFWEPVETSVRPASRRPLELPVAESAVSRIEGAAKLWDALPADARERLRKDGVLVVGADEKAEGADGAPLGIGAFYTDLATRRVPQVITASALFSIVHGGLERALAEIEETEIAPLLQTLLDQLDARLRAEEAGAGTELTEAYRRARGIVAVARSFTGATAPGDKSELAGLVARERGNIEGGAGVAVSPLLGVPVDYAQFALPRATTRPGPYRALSWLAAAPLGLVGRSEAPGSPLDVGQARLDARAAMLLARLCARDVDAQLHAGYTKLLRWLAFVYGPPDDLTLLEVDQLATSAGVDVTKPQDIANVVRVDKVRAKALAGRAPTAFDGTGGIGRGGIAVRLFGGHASSDAIALQSLVGAPAGLAQEAAATDARVRQARRVLPSTLDVAAWLGAREARVALREIHADAFDGYDAALASSVKTRPSEQTSTLHASIHGSLLDALIGYAADGESTGTRSAALDRARLESLLASWTLVRHSGQALARTRHAPAAPAAPAAASPVPVFVETTPEALARLAGAVRQARRGLEALFPSTGVGPLLADLAEIEDVLRVALKGAERRANDEAQTSEESSALAALPGRIARLDPDEDAGPVVAVVYADPPTHRVVATATGKVEPAYTLVREPGKDDVVLAVGAHVGQYEIVEGLEQAPGVVHAVRTPLTDASWRVRLKARAAKRPSYTSAFRLTR